jgi:protein TonB
MSEPIKNISLTFNCPVDWSSMEPLADGKYCAHCYKKVYDLTNSKQDVFLKLLAENNNSICGRFKREQMAPQHIVLPGWKKWLSAALVLVGINIFNNKAYAQGAPLKITNQSVEIKEPDIVVGGIGTASVMPEFPGGDEAFIAFLTKNIHYTKTMKNGRVIISFTVSAKGDLEDFKIERSVSTIDDNAAINALKLSPKWKPGTLNGKPIATRYTIPVSFSNKR